eukprot:scaffold78404_cov32-Tisochrysis_lutea.AAC.3
MHASDRRWLLVEPRVSRRLDLVAQRLEAEVLLLQHVAEHLIPGDRAIRVAVDLHEELAQLVLIFPCDCVDFVYELTRREAPVHEFAISRLLEERFSRKQVGQAGLVEEAAGAG